MTGIAESPAAASAPDAWSLLGCFPGDPCLHPELQSDDDSQPLELALPTSAFVSDAGRTRRGEIAGSLSDLPIADLISLLALGQRSGTLKVSGPRGEACLHFTRGLVREASYGALAGEDAFCRLVADGRGRFEFAPGPPQAGMTLSASTSQLLLEALRRAEPRAPGSASTPTSGGSGPQVTARPDGLPAPGSVIDKYRLEELLGTGGFAAVYRATHLLLRTTVAIKLLKPAIARKHPIQAQRLCEEAQFAAQLAHPSIVRVFDVTHTPRITYIVMEYIEGASLAVRLRESGPLPPRRVLWLGVQVCLALKAALAQGLIHRDVKPANILVSKSGAVKLVDLGLARQVDTETGGARLMAGTPNYMAPEQASDAGHSDFRSDMYSLGVTLYHAALGRLPFSSTNPAEVLAMHRTQAPPPPQALAPGFPREVERLLLWMLEKDPASRPSSYEQLLSGLEEALELLDDSDPGTPAGRPGSDFFHASGDGRGGPS